MVVNFYWRGQTKLWKTGEMGVKQFKTWNWNEWLDSTQNHE